MLFDPITGKRNQICRERTGTPTVPTSEKLEQEVTGETENFGSPLSLFAPVDILRFGDVAGSGLGTPKSSEKSFNRR